MIVADRLRHPDRRRSRSSSPTPRSCPRGGGTGGSRSLQLGGTAVLHERPTRCVERARELAARAAGSRRRRHRGHRRRPRGRGRRAGAGADVGRAGAGGRRRRRRAGPLAAALDFAQEGATFPFGAHVAVVEVDIETGQVRLVRHVAVDDCGRILNPLLVRGPAARRHRPGRRPRRCGSSSSTTRTATRSPPRWPSTPCRARPSSPSFETVNTETPTPLNPLGAKGIGESGTIGSMPAVQNAVIDAVSHLGVRHIDMPCTPERVWRAIATARAGGDTDGWREPPAVFSTLPRRGSHRAPAATADVEI